MKSIIVNATAAKSSGALSILRDYIKYLTESQSSDSCVYHLFTSISEFNYLLDVNPPPIIVHHVTIKSWISRIFWDEGGLYYYCKKNCINPCLIISLQNTCTFFPNIEQLVYYHQPLPIVKYKWNIFIKKEFKLFLYAYFYSYFVKRNSKNANYVVQLPYIKKLFLKKFIKVSEEKVLIIRPNPPQIDLKLIKTITFVDKKFTFFYPATSLSYKNHSVLIDALCLLKENSSEIISKIQIIFTISELERNLMDKIVKNQLQDVFKFIGSVSYTDIGSYYKSVQALLFPSRIETFGLPLLEASTFGLPILVSKLPYAEEVLDEYKNKRFLDPLDIHEWANAIQEYSKLGTNAPLVQTDKTNAWKYFTDYANLLISRR